MQVGKNQPGVCKTTTTSHFHRSYLWVLSHWFPTTFLSNSKADSCLQCSLEESTVALALLTASWRDQSLALSPALGSESSHGIWWLYLCFCFCQNPSWLWRISALCGLLLQNPLQLKRQPSRPPALMSLRHPCKILKTFFTSPCLINQKPCGVTKRINFIEKKAHKWLINNQLLQTGFEPLDSKLV